MATVTQNDLRIRNAHNMVLHLSSVEEPCYMFIGRPEPWMSMIENNPRPRLMLGDESVPYPENNWRDFYRTWDQLLSMNKISGADVFHMIPRISWTSGVTYDMYRHDYNEFNRAFSNAENLYDALFYVISRTNNVYVCLDNNNDTPSLVEPLSETNEPFYTSDGYQWLKLYTVDFYEQVEHSSNNFIPITNNSVNNLPEGAVYTIKIDSRGSGYVSTAFRELYDIDHCYCRINGDGTGAVAKITMSEGRIFEVKVVRPGEGYTRAELDFRPNSVYNSLLDLDKQQNGFDPRGNGAFQTTVIISPPGGWGTDVEEDMIFTLARQLGGTRVGVYSRFGSMMDLCNCDDEYIEYTDFRQVGILDEVDFTMEDNPGNATNIKTVMAIEPINTQATDFRVGETIHQIQTDELDPAVTYIAKGMVISWDDRYTPDVNRPDEKYKILRYIQDPEVHKDRDGNLYEIKGDDTIVGEISKKEIVPDVDFASSRDIEVGSLVFSSGYSKDEVNKYSGNLLYLTNLSPITRQTTQSERISIIISY